MHLTTFLLGDISDNGGLLLLKKEGQRIPAKKPSKIRLDEVGPFNPIR
jgi:hypothetical protein